MADKNTFRLEIISPDGIQFSDEVESLSLPTISGEITILPHHVALFTKLTSGEAKITQHGKTIFIAVSGGFFKFNDNSGEILSDFAVRAESIQEAKAEERKRESEKKLAEKQDTVDFKMIERDLQKSILELKVAQNIKKRQRSQ